jgi:hypothetical protein
VRNIKQITRAMQFVAASKLNDGDFHAARDRLDAAGAVLGDLREAWAEMTAAERTVVGPAAKQVRDRLEAAGRSMPRLSALSVGAPVADPEQDEVPE